MPYTIEDLPELEKWLAEAIEKSKLATERD